MSTSLPSESPLCSLKYQIKAFILIWVFSWFGFFFIIGLIENYLAFSRLACGQRARRGMPLTFACLVRTSMSLPTPLNHPLLIRAPLNHGSFHFSLASSFAVATGAIPPNLRKNNVFSRNNGKTPLFLPGSAAGCGGASDSGTHPSWTPQPDRAQISQMGVRVEVERRRSPYSVRENYTRR